MKEVKKKHITIALLLLPLSLLLTIITSTLFIVKNDVLAWNNIEANDQELCIQGNFLLPGHYSVDSSVPVNKKLKNKTTLFNKFDIFAKTLCFKPNDLLRENEKYSLEISFLGELGLDLFKKEFSIPTTNYPRVMGLEFKEKVNITDTLEYQLDSTNNFLDYYLVAEKQEVLCKKEGVKILCNLAPFDLDYGKEYEILLVTKYDDEYIGVFDTAQIETLSAVKVISSSIDNKSVIAKTTIPEIIIDLNKRILAEATITLEDTLGKAIDLSYEVSGSQITILPESSFKQSRKYYLYIDDLEGIDGSVLLEKYTLEFTISDGPRIVSTNLESTGFATTGNILLTFTQYLKSQDVKKFIKLNSGTDYSYSVSTNKILINPQKSLDPCKPSTLTISKGITGTTDLISTQEYNYTFKTSCGRVSQIGTSVEGRGIYAHSYGTGAKKIIYYGAIHGSEVNSRNILNKWIDELEKNYSKIPSDKTIIVVPYLNPDGIFNETRFNANGVDLNRNFDASDWTEGTYFKEDFYENGGGSNPFSEPESIAIRNLITSQQPYLTLAYHSAAGYVIPSTTTQAQEFAGTYSELSGYTYVSPDSHDSFSYDITGSFDVWAGESGYNSLTIELSSAYFDEFERNVSAMWEMATF